MPNQATARAPESEIVGRLARFFPEATPVRIPIKLSRAANPGDENGAAQSDRDSRSRSTPNAADFFQETIIEFGTPREVLFAIDRPLEFADHVLVESNDGTLHAEASVVAVQYHGKRTVVAVRFLQHVPNWIIKS